MSPLWPMRAFFPAALAAGIAGALAAAGDAGLHADLMVRGYGGALLAGFLMTALPRWTGRPLPGGPALGPILLALWLAARLAPVAGAGRAVLAAAFPVALALMVAAAVRPPAARRDRVVALGVAAFAAGALLDDFRLAVAALLFLVAEIGGRVVPTLTDAVDPAGAEPFPRARPIPTRAATVTAGLGFAAWALAPEAAATGVLAAAAALVGLARNAAWGPWRARRHVAVLMLHVGQAFVPLGFAGLALGCLGLVPVPPGLVLHGWTAGALGLSSVGIMASMVRRRTGRSLVPSTVERAALVAMLAAALLRLGQEIAPQPLLPAAAIAAWTVALGLAAAALAPLWRRRRSWRAGAASAMDGSPAPPE